MHHASFFWYFKLWFKITNDLSPPSPPPPSQRVYCRHALHNIVSVVYYADPTGNPMLAVRVTKGLRHKFDLFVYQCESEVSSHIQIITVDGLIKLLHQHQCIIINK